MTEHFLENKDLGLKIKYDKSINNRYLVGQMNLNISQSQEKLTLKMRKVARDAQILDGLSRKHSEDQRTLTRLEREYGLPDFDSTDETSWSVRLNTLETVMTNLVNNVDTIQSENELKYRKDFIEKVGHMTTKREKEKIEKLDPESVIKVSDQLARKIMGVKEEAQPSESDRKSKH